MNRFCIEGRLYDWALEPLLRSIKKCVAHFISHFDLNPVLDICCGSGVQCYRIMRNRGSAFGLDLNIGMINYAASKYPDIPFMCADAASIPVKNSSMRGAVLSYGLHDKLPETRTRILQEVRRILNPEGKIVFVDFEVPWNGKSRMSSLYVHWIERMAGKDHFRNGRQFLHQGGLRAFIQQNGLEEIARIDIELAQSGVVVARFP